MKPVSIIQAILLFLPLANTIAQTIPMVKYSSEDGLAGNHIHGIFQDHLGFIWMTTTTGGLNKYDGFRRRFFHCNVDLGIQAPFTNNKTHLLLHVLM